MVRGLSVAGLSVLAFMATACDDAVRPFLCACPPEGCAEELRTGPLEKLSCSMPAIESGAGFRILHRVDSTIDAGESVELMLTTPCGTTRLSARHDEDGIVDLPARAPSGASCVLEVRATIANNTLAVFTQGTGDLEAACTAEQMQCEDESSSGGAGAE